MVEDTLQKPVRIGYVLDDLPGADNVERKSWKRELVKRAQPQITCQSLLGYPDSVATHVNPGTRYSYPLNAR
jgi:hypothetical protein